jgi:alpha-galactosidase
MKQPRLYHLACLCIACLCPTPSALAAPRNAPALRLTANSVDGSYAIIAADVAKPVLRATAAVKVNDKWLHATDYPKHIVSTQTTTGELGSAQLTTIRYTGRGDAPDLLLRLRIYAHHPFGDMQLTTTNTTGHAIEIQSLRVLEAKDESGKSAGDGSERALINLGGPAAEDRVLSDSFSEDRPAMKIRDLGDVENHVHRAVGVQLLYNQQSGQSWFIGALTSDKFLSVLRLHMASLNNTEAMTSYEVDSTGTTELLEENSLQDSPQKDRVELSLNLAPGSELSSERMLFSISSDYHDQLETYAHLVRDLHHARITAPTPIGWWSWTAYYFGLNEGTALTNAQWLSQHLKPLGYTFFHMDEGYQYARGEYATPNASLFPQGVGALEHQVLKEGLTPGIWTAPFEVSERSWIYAHHPDWLVHNAQGDPIHLGFVTDKADQLYALDTTNPGAQAYLRSTYSTLANNWGVRYIKMDFMEDSAVEGFYYKPQTTALEAQRIGIQVIRDAVGPNVLLDKDGCELLNPVGLVDMGRISQDTGHTFSSSKDAATGIAARYYMNRNYFLADPDAFSVSTQTVDDQNWHGGAKPLSLEEAKISIALSAVSGGLFEIGDDLPTLGEAADRLALVKNRDLLDMAKLGHASIPLDLMTYDAKDMQPSIFLLKETPRQSIVTVFNWSESVRRHSLTRSMLQLEANVHYTVTEVLGEAAQPNPLAATLTIQSPPHSVRMFKIVNSDVPAKAPAATIKVTATGNAGESISFHAAPADQRVPVLHYTWDFGDGVTMEGADATHAYTHAGVFEAQLKSEGFAPKPDIHKFTITITGTIVTKFMPEKSRRFVHGKSGTGDSPQ